MAHMISVSVQRLFSDGLRSTKEYNLEYVNIFF